MSIEILEKEFCTGCMACKNICPVNAIKIIENNKGFTYPTVDEQACIECHICDKICPILNRKKSSRNQTIYAAKNNSKEVRNSSSSGGVFYELSELILNDNGFVCGAIYDDTFTVVHDISNDKKIRNKMQSSKYVQSQIGCLYEKIEKKLNSNSKVLFSGTPCQVDAIYRYLAYKNASLENLYTCDIICHGVPSPRIYKEYLKDLEKEYESKIKSVNFRFKENSYTQNIRIEFENGKEYISNYFKGDYLYNLFLKDYILRDSCYRCNYANMDRISDITIGDFWGIDKIDKEFDDKKGVSLVIINSLKGERLFNQISKNFDLLLINNKEDCLQNNLKQPCSIPEEYENIWNEYFSKGYDGLKELMKK